MCIFKGATYYVRRKGKRQNKFHARRICLRFRWMKPLCMYFIWEMRLSFLVYGCYRPHGGMKLNNNNYKRYILIWKDMKTCRKYAREHHKLRATIKCSYFVYHIKCNPLALRELEAMLFTHIIYMLRVCSFSWPPPAFRMRKKRKIVFIWAIWVWWTLH